MLFDSRDTQQQQNKAVCENGDELGLTTTTQTTLSLLVTVGFANVVASKEPGARFTKYLTTILRLSYDIAEITIILRRTSNLQNSLQ